MVRIHPDPPPQQREPAGRAQPKGRKSVEAPMGEADVASRARREGSTGTRARATRWGETGRKSVEARGADVYKAYTRRRATKSDVAKGAVAQLGERLLCKQEVIGSIPFSSTSQHAEYRGKRRRLLLISRSDRKHRLLFNNSEEVKRTRRSIVVCWVRLYRPVLPRVQGARVAQTPVIRGTQVLSVMGSSD